MKQTVYMQSARALGSNVELHIVAENQAVADDWFVKLWDRIQKFQNRFSRFLPDSEVTYLNQNAGKKLTIDEDFRKLLKTTKDFSRITKGLFNPFILPEIQKTGYIKSLDNSHLPELNYTKRVVVDASNMALGKSWAHIPENTAIDLGGIGKGYLADELSAVLDGKVDNFCLSLGGDIIARGSAGGDPWVVKVQSVDDPAHDFALIKPTSITFAVATSGTSRRHGSRIQQHIIDPRTFKIAETNYEMCTVVADDATTADVIASCILIDGEKLASELVDNKTIEGVILQKPGGINTVIGTCFDVYDSTQMTNNPVVAGAVYA